MPGDDEDFPADEPGATLTTVVLTVDVESTAFVDEGDLSKRFAGTSPRVPMGIGHFQVDGTPSTVCPKQLGERIALISVPQCCDVRPYQGQCLSPFRPFSIEPDPSQWKLLSSPQ